MTFKKTFPSFFRVPRKKLHQLQVDGPTPLRFQASLVVWLWGRQQGFRKLVGRSDSFRRVVYPKRYESMRCIYQKTDPWKWYICLHEWLKFMVNVGKYASPMDPMGMYMYICMYEYIVYSLFAHWLILHSSCTYISYVFDRYPSRKSGFSKAFWKDTISNPKLYVSPILRQVYI